MMLHMLRYLYIICIINRISRMSSNEEEEYEVDRIINDRVEKGEKQYLIRWKNFGA